MPTQTNIQNTKEVLTANSQIRSSDFAQLIGGAKELLTNGTTDLVLDLTKLTYVSGSVCGLIVGLWRWACQSGAKLAVVVPEDAFAYSIMDIAGLYKLIPTIEPASIVLAA